MQRQSLITSHQQTDARPVSRQPLPWKNSPYPPHCFTAEHGFICYAISLWSAQVSCLCYVPFQPLVLPTLWGSRVKNREVLDIVQALFSFN